MVLTQVLRHLPKITDPALLVGLENSDDAAVYRLNDDLALVVTLDFITPVCDDPYLFGQVAAANALSDIYAMGAKPLLALNIIGFPDCLPPQVLTQILQGGAAKVQEAGALLVGGHSVSDDEPKYGLAVVGLVHPNDVWSNSAGNEGELLYLTKPLGSGVLISAMRKGAIATHDELWRSLCHLNNDAYEAARKVGISAATDITGFGLLGHVMEMARAGSRDILIEYSSLPLYSQLCEFIDKGIVPGGTERNRAYVEAACPDLANLTPNQVAVLCDPQTSGGLLISVDAAKAEELELAFKHKGVFYARIGKTLKGTEGKIFLKTEACI